MHHTELQYTQLVGDILQDVQECIKQSHKLSCIIAQQYTKTGKSPDEAKCIWWTSAGKWAVRSGCRPRGGKFNIGALHTVYCPHCNYATSVKKVFLFIVTQYFIWMHYDAYWMNVNLSSYSHNFGRCKSGKTAYIGAGSASPLTLSKQSITVNTTQKVAFWLSYCHKCAGIYFKGNITNWLSVHQHTAVW